jgi:hypothetical protein
MVSTAFSSGRGETLKKIGYVSAYVLPGAVIWGILSIGFWGIGNIPFFSLGMACLYAYWFGVRETYAVPCLVPSLAWQVPARWLKGRPVAKQILIWGFFLGPGFLTRNPYAGIWALPFLIALQRQLLSAIVIGVAIGILHGGLRAISILHMSQKQDLSSCTLHYAMGIQWHWQFMDGLYLLLTAGMLTAYMIMVIHF